MMQFFETFYTDPLLKFLVDVTLKSFVIFAIAGVFAFCLRPKSAAVRGFVSGTEVPPIPPQPIINKHDFFPTMHWTD